MPKVKVSELINRAKTAAQDIDFVRWPETEWLDWYNECLLVLANLRTDAWSEVRDLPINKNTSMFDLPADADRLLDVYQYSKTGRVVRPIDRRVLDEQHPFWHTEKSVDGPRYYVYSEDTPRVFHIYPSAIEITHRLKVVVSRAPVKATSTDADIAVEDRFAPAIVDYILYRAYLKDADYTDDMGRSKFFLDGFYVKAGVKNDEG